MKVIQLQLADLITVVGIVIWMGGGRDFQSISKGSEEMKECCHREGRDEKKRGDK